MKHVITVIGAGNGGTAIAAHLTSAGAKTRLCDLFPQYIEGIKTAGGIELTDNGKTVFVSPALVTDDVPAAVQGAKLIMVVTPAFTHKMIAEKICDTLEDGQIIVLNPGRTAGALEFYNTLRTKGCEKDVIVAEAQTLIYSTRKTGDHAVHIYGTKQSVDLSAFPGNRIREVLEVLSPYYPQFTPVPSVLKTSLTNIGSMFHPTPILLNIGRIESDERGFRYYWDGITPSVAALIEKLDAERVAVAKAYDVEVPTAKEWLLRSYTTHGDSLFELIRNNDAYGEIKAPTTIQARYMTEDVPNGLVPIAALGAAAGVSTPNINAVITLACSIYSRDFRKEGRSLENLGLAGMEKEEICQYFKTGRR